MNKFIRRALIILGLPNSLYLCLRTMPLKKAIRFLSLSGTIKVNEEKFGSVRMGFDGLAVAYSKPICIENDGNIFIGGHVNFGGVPVKLSQWGQPNYRNADKDYG